MAEEIVNPANMGKQRVEFYKDDALGRDMVRIWAIGDTCDFHAKVTPEHTARFAREWAAYEQGKGEIDVGGTPLMDVPGVDRYVATALKLKGVRNAEELAALDEAACSGIGMGALTWAKSAKNLINARRFEEMEALRSEAPRRGRPPKDKDPVETGLEA